MKRHPVGHRQDGALEGAPLATLLFNLKIGPFDSAAWWRQGKEGVAEYAELADDDDPLPMAFLDDIADERNERDRIHEASFRQEIIRGPPELLQSKGCKVPRSRWLHFVDIAAEHDVVWSSRLLALLYMGLRTGYVNSDGGLKFRLQLSRGGAASSSHAEPPRATTSGRALGVLSVLRPNSKNTMHVATCLCLERYLKVHNRIVTTMAEPSRRWHGKNCAAHRDEAACKDVVSNKPVRSCWFRGLRCSRPQRTCRSANSWA